MLTATSMEDRFLADLRRVTATIYELEEFFTTPEFKALDEYTKGVYYYRLSAATEYRDSIKNHVTVF